MCMCVHQILTFFDHGLIHHQQEFQTSSRAVCHLPERGLLKVLHPCKLIFMNRVLEFTDSSVVWILPEYLDSHTLFLQSFCLLFFCNFSTTKSFWLQLIEREECGAQRYFNQALNVFWIDYNETLPLYFLLTNTRYKCSRTHFVSL